MTNKEYAIKLLSLISEEVNNIDAIEEGELDILSEDLLSFLRKEPLFEVLKETADLYHNFDGINETYLTDGQYNLLESLYKSFFDDNIPVGSDVRGGKIPLPYPMGSLTKSELGDTINWITENSWGDEYFIIGDKQDGTSGLSMYYDGKLRISYSRGNGREGADITRHIKMLSNCPTVLKENIPGEFSVRFEVIIPYEVFAEYNQNLITKGLRSFKNARNYVAGRMNAEDGDDWFYKNAKIIATSVINFEGSKKEEYELLEKLGFEVTPWIREKGSCLTDEFLIAYLENRKSKSPTEIDGIVIDIDSWEIRDELSELDTNLNPKYAKKFKIGSEDNIAETKVVKVHWRASKSGYLKPRVEIEPVELSGVTVTYATGFNAKFIVDNGIGPESVIKLTRSGDVIPHIISVTKKVDPILPDEDFYWSENDVDIILEDPDSSDEVIVNKLNNIFAKLEIPFLRKASVEKLVESGYKNAADIIKLDKSTLQRIIGDSNGEKVFDGIKKKLNPVDLNLLAGASHTLGRGLGVRKMEMLSNKLGDDCLLRHITIREAMSAEGFSDKMAYILVKNLHKFHSFLKDINGYYTLKEKEKPVSDILNGVKVCFTGIRDKDLENAIKSKGGEVIKTIKKDPGMFLVCKDPSSNSDKMNKAREKLSSSQIISIQDARKRWM